MEPPKRPSMILGEYQGQAATKLGISRQAAWDYIQNEVPEHFKQPCINHLQFLNKLQAKKDGNEEIKDSNPLSRGHGRSRSKGRAPSV